MVKKKQHSQGGEQFADSHNALADATHYDNYSTYRNTIFNGDCLEVLKALPNGLVDCCVTSPPYYGLRDYGTGTWVGGDPSCPHRRMSKQSAKTITGHAQEELKGNVGDAIYKSVCPLCGAVRVDKQIGLEESPEEYIDRLINVFREVKRVLKDDGTLWLNIGDSYWGSGSRGWDFDGKLTEAIKVQAGSKGTISLQNLPKLVGNRDGYKNKDLIGIPWMLAFALRADGWYLRQDIIWHKPNPMPESVKDRCVRSHEYIFLLSKKRNYYFDYQAIQEDAVSTYDSRTGEGRIAYEGKRTDGNDEKAQQSFVWISEKRNKRDVWSIPPSTISEAHFATFPEKLVEQCVLAGCPQGGIVLDPFFGSGTTGRVALGLCRDFVGIELNEQYVEIAKKRTDEIQTTLFC